ncbi:MAG: hypothetical protein A3H98_14120 [Bacteroidetes bacterium RIFCSPLOWO2_02_FULL_36_8]|nr:MAG: hypothetical protein A3H98_14120 [Bacteroidetes bacterium RIFCSPLOWO2_02_FULL_36_8]
MTNSLFNIKRDSKLKSSVNLIIIQICLFFIPLIATPYIVGKVGVEKYGTYVFYLTVAGVLSIVVSYSFLQTGVRDISSCTSLKRLNYEYSQIIYSKLVLLIAALLVSPIFFCFDKFNSEKVLFLFSLLYLVVSFLDVSFVYQGIEKLKDYVIVNFIVNIIYVGSLLAFIKNEDDYIRLPIVFALPRITVLIFSICALYLRFGIAPNYFSVKGIVKRLKNGFRVFLVVIFSQICTRFPIIFLGYVSGNTYVGYYAIAEQLITAFSMLVGKSSAVYQPQIAFSLKRNLMHGVHLAKENIQIIVITSIAGVLFTQFFAHELLYLLFKENSQHSVLVMKILSSTLIFQPIGGILGVHVLLAMHKDKELFKGIIFATIIVLTLGWIPIYYFNHIGVSITVVIVELFTFIYMYVRCKAYGIEVFSKELFVKNCFYSLLLILALIGFKYAYDCLDINFIGKLSGVILLYTLYVALLLKLLKMVDFKGRKILI